MLMRQSFLTVKLHELEQQGKLQSRIRLIQKEEPEDIRRELHKLEEECEKEDFLLKQSVENARSEAVTSLAEAQLGYDRKLDGIVKNVLLDSLHGKESFHEDRAESAMVYAEYSIDFALRASKNALCAALRAIALEIECEEWRKEHE